MKKKILWILTWMLMAGPVFCQEVRITTETAARIHRQQINLEHCEALQRINELIINRQKEALANKIQETGAQAQQIKLLKKNLDIVTTLHRSEKLKDPRGQAFKKILAVIMGFLGGYFVATAF